MAGTVLRGTQHPYTVPPTLRQGARGPWKSQMALLGLSINKKSWIFKRGLGCQKEALGTPWKGLGAHGRV